ncbi:MAG TPA: winged helix-turn-helix domain-containing protein [Vicinamibacterales bacterium]|nr:winged helix-turn-helix domain-containing protein [Vicinamibacterales bacterium]
MIGQTGGPDDKLYAFGPYVADPVTGTLRQDGTHVVLTLKSFEVLVALIERRGQVVDKDTLLKLVWPDTIVEENNLARHISTLRKALNDHPHDHQFIVTIPGRGYRFVAPVRELSRSELPSARPPTEREHPAPQAEAQSPNRPEPPVAAQAILAFARTRAAMLAAAGVVAVGITGITVLGDFPRPEVEAPDRKLWQLTSSDGLESDATWAPNGQAIAYSSDREGNFDIWSQPIGDGQAVRLTSSSSHDWQPSWSPDGKHVVFRSERDGGGLFVVSATGGNERRITNFGYRPQWSPREDTILFSSSNTVRSKMYTVRGDGTQRQVLSAFLDGFESYRAKWHPDGRRVSVYGQHTREGLSFWTVSLDGASAVRSAISADVATRLKKTGVSLTEFSWSPLANALYFEGRSEETVNIWRVGVDPQTQEWRDGPERVTVGGGLDTDISLSPDGQKLAFTVRNESTRLWALPFDPVEGRVLGKGEPITPKDSSAMFPDVPPTGTHLSYRTIRRGRHELHRRSLTGNEHRSLPVTGELHRPRWSDDGTMLAFRRLMPPPTDGTPRRNAVVIMATDGTGERNLTMPALEEVTPYDWSANGRSILASCEQGPPRRMTICALPVDAAPRAKQHARTIAADPDRSLYQATFSPNQRWVAFNATSPGLSSIYVVSVDGGQWSAVSEGTSWDDKPRWSPDGKTVYFLSNRSGFFNVWGRRFDPATGKSSGDPFRVTNLENPSERVTSPVTTMELAIAPNLLVLPIAEVSGSVWVLENLTN